METLNTSSSVTLCSICLFSLTFFQRFFFVCLDKENLNLIAFVSLDLAGQTFEQFHADSHAQKLLFPSSLLEIQYGGQQVILYLLSCQQQDLFRKTFSNILFLNCPCIRNLLYVFRENGHYKFIFLLSLSLDLLAISWLLKELAKPSREDGKLRWLLALIYNHVYMEIQHWQRYNFLMVHGQLP